ncbi:MAG TPA: hypothetical protein EYQ27_11655, partial [Gemmatimonadetes bacterium]|nr:hypothetical protein [Gemmatimonadota bacterium]
MVYWTLEPVRFTMDLGNQDDPDIHAVLTESGTEKVKASRALRVAPDLQPGEDYVVKETAPAAADWYPLDETKYTAEYRHSWVFVRNHRPKDPMFLHCPMPRRGEGEQERNAALVMTYFHPFTLNPDFHAEHVPFMGQLCASSDSWQGSMTQWLDGRILCDESRRYVINFLAVARVRPDDDDADAHSDDLISDDELVVDNANFEEAISTRMGSGKHSADSRMQSEMLDEFALPTADSPDVVAENVQDAFRRARSYWPLRRATGDLKRTEGVAMDTVTVDKIRKAAKASQQQSNETPLREQEPRPAVARIGREYSTEDVQAWLRKIRLRRTKSGAPFLKKGQLVMLEKVCERVCAELREEGNGEDYSTPLLWMMHGGPGVGKSETVKLLREFFTEVLHWNMGVDFQMAALQAVMAEQLGGDTLHHSCGISKGGLPSADGGGHATRRQTEVAKAVLQWRWLIIDEISMVSSQLLAEVDMKLRNIVRNLGTGKLSESGDVRPFGGINVLFVGDFWQLDPPKGGFLGNIPVDFIRRARQYDPKPDATHGESIFWGTGEHSVQGITELEECVRTEDPWLLEVQQQMRDGELSEDNWNFLHGRPTKVPGSWENRHCGCHNPICEKLSGAADIEEKECSKCKGERESKCRVIQHLDDSRTREEKFLAAPAIFPNNDIKYEVAKKRAQIFAAEKKQALTWSKAHDTPSSAVLSEKPDIVREKLQWLKRHDRECGDLYGMLPLAHGLPVALTDHLDRSPDKNLLRGKLGFVESWVEDEREDSAYDQEKRILRYVPRVVFVQYYEQVWSEEKKEFESKPCTWIVDGVGRPGVYPVFPWKRSWHLDQHRAHPKLEVKRYQVPLAPWFAMTAHAAQGRTLLAAIIDLQIGRGVNPIASYVAMTRVKHRTDILIYRPFDREVFARGPPEGPSLLLKHLRGEPIDWAPIEKRLTPKRKCHGPCLMLRFKDEFGKREWLNRIDPHCSACMAKLQNAGTPVRCSRCRSWCATADFAATVMEQNLTQRLCRACVSQGKPRSCSACGAEKPVDGFTPSM